MTSHPVTLKRRKSLKMQNSRMRRVSRRLRQDPAASASEQSKLFDLVDQSFGNCHCCLGPMQQA
jgi:hypothetical protein